MIPRLRRSAGFFTSARRTLILGTGPLARELVEVIRSRAHSRYTIVGVVDESGATPVEPFPCPLAGTLDDLQRIMVDLKPDRIIVALAERREYFPLHQLVEARVRRGAIVESGEEVYEHLTRKIAIDVLTPSSVIFSKDFRPSSFSLTVTRGLSLFVATVGLIVFAPLFFLIAVAIKLDSRGPVLFVQSRIGRGGRRFKLLKFRTMRPTQAQRSEWVGDNDDQITRVGRWLRRFRLDELPQFVNILYGDMNLVGPRPHPTSNFELLSLVARNTPRYGDQIPYYSLRTMIRPGVTGWAQVRYHYANNLDEEMEKLRYDLYYIKNFSIWRDLLILFETIRVVLVGREREVPGLRASTDREGLSAPAHDEVLTPPRVLFPRHRSPLQVILSKRTV